MGGIVKAITGKQQAATNAAGNIERDRAQRTLLTQQQETLATTQRENQAIAAREAAAAEAERVRLAGVTAEEERARRARGARNTGTALLLNNEVGSAPTTTIKQNLGG